MWTYLDAYVTEKIPNLYRIPKKHVISLLMICYDHFDVLVDQDTLTVLVHVRRNVSFTAWLTMIPS